MVVYGRTNIVEVLHVLEVVVFKCCVHVYMVVVVVLQVLCGRKVRYGSRFLALCLPCRCVGAAGLVWAEAGAGWAVAGWAAALEAAAWAGEVLRVAEAVGAHAAEGAEFHRTAAMAQQRRWESGRWSRRCLSVSLRSA